jgi:hypothetical protein
MFVEGGSARRDIRARLNIEGHHVDEGGQAGSQRGAGPPKNTICPFVPDARQPVVVVVIASGNSGVRSTSSALLLS